MIFNFIVPRKLNLFTTLSVCLILQGTISLTPLFPPEANNLKKGISQPHSVIFANVMGNIQAGFNEMKAYVKNQLTQQKFEQENEVFIFESDDLTNSSPSLTISDELFRSERNLQQTITIPSTITTQINGIPSILDSLLPTNMISNVVNTNVASTPIIKVSTLKNGSCENNGKELTLNVNIYTCNGTRVSKSQYDSLKTTQSCKLFPSQIRKVCYCSFEYYGDKCEVANAYTCELDFLGPLSHCEGKDSFDYVYSYSGTPPCNLIKTGQNISIQ